MKNQTWTNVRGVFSIEVYRKGEKVYDSDHRELSISPELVNEDAELTIEFVSSGYYDPGRKYGSPDDCYPPEGDDERELDCCYLDEVELDKKTADNLWNLYEDMIYEVDLD